MSYRYEIHRNRFRRAATMEDGVRIMDSDQRYETRTEALHAGDRWSDKWVDAWTEVYQSNEEVNA